MKNIFAITNFIDKARWNSVENYSEINYANSNMYDSLKILTHYIAYVTDRQMPFQRIWNIGGYVFSKLVEEYSSTNQSVETLFSKYYSIDENKLSFKCSIDNTLTPEQKEKLQLSDSGSDEVRFSSRFVTTDFCSIYYTLYILKKLADKLLIEYIKKVIRLHFNPQTDTFDDNYSKDIVKRIAFALYILTYQNNKIKANGQSIEEYIKMVKESAKKQLDIVKSTLANLDKFNNKYNNFCKGQIFKCKRVWCALRDYMKWDPFKGYFGQELSTILASDICDVKYLEQLELPGDVWNNNSTFIQCNFPDKSTEQFNKYLRKKFNKDREGARIIQEGYVEQFDITFSLAPRMCESKLCNLCPYGILKKGDHKFQHLCVDDTSKYCPILLHSTGFIYQCVGKEGCTLCKVYAQRK